MDKFNERGAGRKKALSARDIHEIKKRRLAGETVASLAREYGVSRQTLSGYLNAPDKIQELHDVMKLWAKMNREFRTTNLADYNIRMEYMCVDRCCTIILVDTFRERIKVVNTTDEIIHRAFGVKVEPVWEDFMDFLEERCFPRTRDHARMILDEMGLDCYDPFAIVEKTQGRMAEDLQWIKITEKPEVCCGG